MKRREKKIRWKLRQMLETLPVCDQVVALKRELLQIRCDIADRYPNAITKARRTWARMELADALKNRRVVEAYIRKCWSSLNVMEVKR